MIHAARAALLWSCVHGGPIDFPICEIFFTAAVADFPKTDLACVSRSRSRTPDTWIFNFSHAFQTARRKNSPSAVWINGWEASMSDSDGSGRPDASTTAHVFTA